MPHDPTIETDREPIEESHRHARRGDLVETTPREMLGIYLREIEPDTAVSTRDTHQYRLEPLMEFCEDEGISNLNTLTPRHLLEYKHWLRENRDLNKVSRKHYLDTARCYLRIGETAQAVRPNLAEKLPSPSLSEADHSRDAMLEEERAMEILSHLSRFEYASVPHVILLLFAETGARLGAVHGLDVPDFNLNPQGETPHLEFVHRPGETPLKNGEDGERHVFINNDVTEVLDAYLEHSRDTGGVPDGKREPLITTSKGRMAQSTIRKRVYQWTRPCAIGNDCPHQEDPNECIAAQRANHASKCPSSLSPHPVRRGYLTSRLRDGVPRDILGDRTDVSEDVLLSFYDQRTAKERMQQRKKVFESAQSDGFPNRGE